MGRTIIPIGDAQAIAGAGAADVTFKSSLLPDRGIIGFYIAVNGAGNQLSVVNNLQIWAGDQKVRMVTNHLRRYITRWSEASLVPADADTTFSIPLNLGPMGRTDDRYQLAPGSTTLVINGTWAAAGSVRCYVVTTDERPNAFVEIHSSAPFAAGAGGPSEFVPPKMGNIVGFCVENDVIDESYWMDEQGRRRWVFSIGAAPDPSLEIERMEDGSAAAHTTPGAYLLRGPMLAERSRFTVQRLAGWVAADEISTVHHVAA